MFEVSVLVIAFFNTKHCLSHAIGLTFLQFFLFFELDGPTKLLLKLLDGGPSDRF